MMTRRAKGEEGRAADAGVMSREQAEQLVQKVIKLSKADSIQVNVGGAKPRLPREVHRS